MVRLVPAGEDGEGASTLDADAADCCSSARARLTRAGLRPLVLRPCLPSSARNSFCTRTASHLCHEQMMSVLVWAGSLGLAV